MGKRWRAIRGISLDDVWRSGTNSYVVLESAPDLRVTSCSRCRKVPQPVVEINATTMSDFGPLPFDLSSLHPAVPMQQLRAQVQRQQQSQQQQQQQQRAGTQFMCGSAILERVSAAAEAMMQAEDKQLELFCFDNCRTHCTSSRLHLGSRLILVMLFPGNIASFSEPFELLSKKPRSRRRKDANSITESQDSKQQDMTMIQVPTAITMVPTLLLANPPSQPAMSVDVEPSSSSDNNQQKHCVKSSLLDIAAVAAVAEEEIEAAEVAKKGDKNQKAEQQQQSLNVDVLETSQQQQQQQHSPKQKKARLRDIAS